MKAEFNGYTYKDLNLNGNIRNGKFDVVADMDDPNLDFDMQANGGFDGKYPNGKIKINVDIADLEKLNLHAGPLKLRGNVDADITNGNPANLNGIVTLHHFMFNNGKEQFALDSINIAAVSTPQRNEIVLRSQIINASVVGKYELTQVGTALANSIRNYYDTNPAAPVTPTPPQHFTFTVRVNDDPIWQKLMPQLERIEPIDIN